MAFIGIGIVAVALGVSALFTVAGMWLDQHSGWHRWQLWLMAVIASAPLGSELAWAR